jgi:hypothetical protein
MGEGRRKALTRQAPAVVGPVAVDTFAGKIHVLRFNRGLAEETEKIVR